MKLQEVKKQWSDAQDAQQRFKQQNDLLVSRLAARVEVMERLTIALQAYEELEQVKVELLISERKPVKPVGKVEVVS